MSKAEKEPQPTKLGPYTKLVLSTLRERPELLLEENFDDLRTELYRRVPELSKKSECAMCGAGMMAYLFKLDYLNAILVLQMGKIVRERLEQYGDFTQANQVAIHDLPISYAAKSRTTQASKLGLIAQLRGKNGKRVPGVWVITSRGFQALAGKPVPFSVRVFRGQILERPDELITLGGAFRHYNESVTARVRAHKKIKSDYRDITESYQASDWVEFSPVENGL